MFQGRTVILIFASVSIGFIFYFLIRQTLASNEITLPPVSIGLVDEKVNKDNDISKFKKASSSPLLSEANLPKETTVLAKPSSESGESVLFNAISLIKQNVPSPFIVFDKNFRLTWEDFIELLAIYEAQGSPFRYTRSDSEKLGSGNWYITQKGYDEKGNPLFIILDLNTFGEEAEQMNQYVFEQEFINLNTSNDYGVFQPEIENLVYDTIYDSLSGDDIDFQVKNLTCRKSKCMLRIDYGQSTHLDIDTLQQRIQAALALQNPNKSCNHVRNPIASGGQMIEVICE